MGAEKPTYAELESRLAEKERLISALHQNKIDALIGADGVYLLRLRTLQKKLEQSEVRLKHILQTVPVGIGIVSEQRVILEANFKLCQICGYRRKELVGRNTRMLYVSEEDYADVDRETSAQIQARGQCQVETQIQRKDGRIRRVLLTATPIELEDLSSGVLYAVQDISEQKRQMQQLQRMHLLTHKKKIEAENMSEDLQQYTYAITHDLKAPLRAISNYVSFLYEDLADALDAEQMVYLDGVKKAVQQGNAMIQDLFHLTRLDHVARQKETFSLQDILKQIRPMLENDRDVVMNVQTGFPRFRTTRVLLRHLFQNLITNAVKFNHSNPKRIDIGWQPIASGGFKIFVTDNGIGIAPEYHQQIFQIFRRLHAEKDAQGTGVGLAVVKKIVQRLQGDIRIVSTPGKGSTFYLRLPASVFETEAETCSKIN